MCSKIRYMFVDINGVQKAKQPLVHGEVVKKVEGLRCISYIHGRTKVVKELVLGNQYEEITFDEYKVIASICHQASAEKVNLLDRHIIAPDEWAIQPSTLAKKDGESLYLVSKYIESVALENVLPMVMLKDISKEQATQLLTDMYMVIATLRHYGLVHTDLGPSNILITPEYRMYLSDFGGIMTIEDYQTFVHGKQILWDGDVYLQLKDKRPQISPDDVTGLIAFALTLSRARYQGKEAEEMRKKVFDYMGSYTRRCSRKHELQDLELVFNYLLPIL